MVVQVETLADERKLEYSRCAYAGILESVLAYEGTSEVHQLVIGQALTGESAFT